VATRLARRHGLRLYRSDARTWAHRDRALAAGHTAAQRFETLPPNERWALDTEELVALSLHRDRGPMVVEDLRALPVAPLVLAEGSSLPAALVAPGSALWLLPAAAFQQAQLASRGLEDGTRRLYERLRSVIAREAEEHGVPTLEVDGALGIDDVLALVEARFAPALAAGPRATSIEERRALLREVNLASVDQVRGYHARPWADGDADAVEWSFVCECGGPGCEADVVLTVADAASGPVTATGHARR
jgi:hypothetical protein